MSPCPYDGSRQNVTSHRTFDHAFYAPCKRAYGHAGWPQKTEEEIPRRVSTWHCQQLGKRVKALDTIGLRRSTRRYLLRQ
jgi:hypothetical protein